MNFPIYFYLPRNRWPDGTLPRTVEENPEIYFLGTSLNWVLQTYLRLRAAGFQVQLVPEMPKAGIIVTFNGLLKLDYHPNPEQFLVSISADNATHFFAQMHIVQNLEQTRILSDSFHIPHWPQPGIKHRVATAGNRFLRAAFFGDVYNLAPELQTAGWIAELKGSGLAWSIRGPQSREKLDYSDVDLLVAVRSFERKGYIRKPASKLYNAWISGIPAVLGNEFAFREARKSELDYIEVQTYEEACAAIRTLAASPLLRIKMIENGFQRAREVSIPTLVERWRVILFEEAIERFERWRSLSKSGMHRFVARRLIQKKIRGIRHRLLRFLEKEQNAL
jgi:hypothetical protein